MINLGYNYCTPAVGFSLNGITYLNGSTVLRETLEREIMLCCVPLTDSTVVGDSLAMNFVLGSFIFLMVPKCL